MPYRSRGITAPSLPSPRFYRETVPVHAVITAYMVSTECIMITSRMRNDAYDATWNAIGYTAHLATL